MSEPEITRTHFRVMMFYDFKRGLTFAESHENLTKAFGDGAISLNTVRRWYDEFHHGRASFEDDPRSGRPREMVTPENVERVRRLVDAVAARVIGGEALRIAEAVRRRRVEASRRRVASFHLV